MSNDFKILIGEGFSSTYKATLTIFGGVILTGEGRTRKEAADELARSIKIARSELQSAKKALYDEVEGQENMEGWHDMMEEMGQ